MIQYKFLDIVFDIFGERGLESHGFDGPDLAATEGLLCNLNYLFYSNKSEKHW